MRRKPGKHGKQGSHLLIKQASKNISLWLIIDYLFVIAHLNSTSNKTHLD